MIDCVPPGVSVSGPRRRAEASTGASRRAPNTSTAKRHLRTLSTRAVLAGGRYPRPEWPDTVQWSSRDCGHLYYNFINIIFKH